MILQQLYLFIFASAPSGCEKSFFGLIPWYHYLNSSSFNPPPDCSIKDFNFLGASSDLPLVLVAVVDDLLKIAGIVAVAFVLIGAFKYVNSQGDPEGTARAQSTIINALLGTAIAIVATLFVNFLGQRLGG